MFISGRGNDNGDVQEVEEEEQFVTEQAGVIISPSIRPICHGPVLVAQGLASLLCLAVFISSDEGGSRRRALVCRLHVHQP